MLGPFATASRRTPHCHLPGVATVASHAACASMSTTTTRTTRDRGDRYGPTEWAQRPWFKVEGNCEENDSSAIYTRRPAEQSEAVQMTCTRLEWSGIALGIDTVFLAHSN